MKKDCEIVNDLLPLYIDDVCSKSSSSFVERHLKKCKDCEKKFQKLSGNIVNEVQDENVKEKNYKELFNRIKFNYILKTILITLLIMFPILVWITNGNIFAVNIDSLHINNKANQLFTALKESDHDKINNLFTEDGFKYIFKTERTNYTKNDFYNNLTILKEKGVEFTKIKFGGLKYDPQTSIFDGVSSANYKIYYKYDNKENYINFWIVLDNDDKGKILFWAYAHNDEDSSSIARQITNTFNPIIYYNYE